MGETMVKSRSKISVCTYIECIRQKIKPIKGPILFYMDILISKEETMI